MVDVDDPSIPPISEGGEDLHVAGQNDQIDVKRSRSRRICTSCSSLVSFVLGKMVIGDPKQVRHALQIEVIADNQGCVAKEIPLADTWRRAGHTKT